MRDITLGDTLYHMFTTRAFATGVPTVLSGSPVLSVLEENNATPITAGVTVSVDRASVVGLNQASIVATSGNGYESGKTYAIYISTGTVGGVSVVGEVIGHFTVEKSSSFIRLGAPDGASVSADLAAIEAQTNDIGAAGAGLTAIPTQDANVIKVAGSSPAATNLSDMMVNAYDAANNRLDCDVVAVSGDTVSADNMELDYDGTGYNKSNSTIGTVTVNTDMVGTDNAALASVCTEARLSELDAATGGKMANQVDVIEGQTDDIGVAGAGLTALPISDANLTKIGGVVQSATDLKDFVDAGYDPATNKVQGVVLVDTTTVNTDVRGTDSAALASVCTEGRLAELDAANLPSDLDAVLADTGTDGVKLNATQPAGWAANLVASAGQVIKATVDTVVNTHTPTTTEFQADDIMEATGDHYKGRIVIFTSGALVGQATDITAYALVGTIGQFTVTAMTEAPANNDQFIVV